MLSFRLQFLMLILAGVTFSTLSPAAESEEKRPLDHSDYDSWNSVGSPSLSHDGKWASFQIVPSEGDTTLVIQSLESDQRYTIEGGSRLRFNEDSTHAVYAVAPSSKLLEKLRAEKKDETELPQSKIQILELTTGEAMTIERASRFTLPAKNGNWLALTLIADKRNPTPQKVDSGLGQVFKIAEGGLQRPAQEFEYQEESKQEKSQAKETQETESSPAKESGSKPEMGDKKRSPKSKKDKRTGQVLVLHNMYTGMQLRFPFVTSFRFSENAKYLGFSTSGKEPGDDGVHLITLDDLSHRALASGQGEYGQPVFSKDESQLAFLCNRDDYEAERPQWSLFWWRTGRKEAEAVVEPNSDDIAVDWELAQSSAPQFSENGRRLFFRTRPTPPSDSDEKDKDPVAKLDLWHWQDPFLQPQQKLRAQQERNRTYQAVYDLRQRRVIQLADREVPSVRIDPRSEATNVLGTSTAAYEKKLSWDIQGLSDWYLIDLSSGDRHLIAKGRRGSPVLSPDGKYVYWWDGEQRTWLALSIDGVDDTTEKSPIDLGSGIRYPLQDELHDLPALPGSYGIAGWTEGDEAVIIYDRWDMWAVSPKRAADARCLTGGLGRDQLIRFRAQRLDSEQRYVNLDEPAILSARVHSTKASGYYRWTDSESDGPKVEPLIVLDEQVSGLIKAKAADTVLFTRSTFERFPDLWSSTIDFETTQRLSRANPQQSEFLWGTAELTRWKAEDGQELDGILYKPEGFDPTKKYPLLVYFYERNSDNLHRHYVPAPGRSIINFSFYTSRGYVIFVPDIPYKIGEPGPSAANAVLPGVQHVVDQGFIDEERIGMQGHSWGGYQVAYLVTVSDKFACAESGAPVSNMTSAYGGIRWGSGMSRMFQYEKTQSRIGATLWEARDKYLLNSPLFAADKIHTPLLILHNDQDTAVPWYQGIELFVALRRLERPAWMLNYNGEPHWVMTDENRLDFNRRMQQFFDHYLKGDPMPVWMAEGIPAVDKGEEFGFEYVRPAEKSEESTKASSGD